jgi:hypothetical protein
MLKRIWLVQPMAFARVGGSSTPLRNYYWSTANLSPHGSGRTRVVATESLEVAEDGTVNAVPPPENGEIVFKDDEGIRPACPFFELHGEWDGGSGPITPEVLEQNGLSLADITWDVHQANHKAFHLTGAEGDKIESRIEIAGDDHAIKRLEGTPPAGADNPILLDGKHILKGRVQVTRPTQDFPGLRLRFYAPPGHAFAPSNFWDRLDEDPSILRDPGEWVLAKALGHFFGRDWSDFDIPDERLIVNPDSPWPKFGLLQFENLPEKLVDLLPHLGEAKAVSSAADQSELLRTVAGPTADVGNLPPGLFAYTVGPNAVQDGLGMVDDMSDGIITCRIKGVGEAYARVAVSPPHFAPDRRQPVSLADGLADRVMRDDVRSPDWTGDAENWEATRASVNDLLERAYETAGLANIDVWNNWFIEENSTNAQDPDSTVTPEQAGAMLWNTDNVPSVEDLPLTAIGRRRHRRNTATEFFDDLARENPDLIERWIRTPGEPKHLYDKRMPAVMRGADRYPFHITRRQYDEMKAWAAKLNADAKAAQSDGANSDEND